MFSLLLTLILFAVGLGAALLEPTDMGHVITTRNVEPQATQVFTIVMLPDTQRLCNNPSVYDELIQYIVDQKVARNIKMVLHVGDTVDDGTNSSFHAIADSALAKLEGQIPFLIGIGNKDYDDGSGASRTASAFNAAHPLSMYQNYDWFIDDEYPTGETANTAAKITVGQTTYLFINIEYLPRTAAITWAQGIVDDNPDADHIIVSNHYVLENNGVRGSNAAITDLWDDFLSQNAKIRLVLSGHVGGTTTTPAAARRTDNGVHQHVLNPQTITGDNWADGALVRFYEIDQSDHSVSVTTYNPHNEVAWTDSANQFTFNLVE